MLSTVVNQKYIITNTPNLTFNIVTFNHPQEEYTFRFTDNEQEKLSRVHNSLLPGEVIKEFAEKEHYYTSFEDQVKGYLAVTK